MSVNQLLKSKLTWFQYNKTFSIISKTSLDAMYLYKIVTFTREKEKNQTF